VFDKSWVEPLANVLERLGSKHVLVVHADDGMDEISIGSATFVAELKNGRVSTYYISPKDFGLRKSALASLAVDGASQSLAVINDVLANKAGAALDIVLLNAGAAIYVSGLATSLAEGVKIAKTVIANGDAKAKLDQLVRFSNSL